MSETVPDNETPPVGMTREQLEAEVARMRIEHIDRLEYLRTLHDLGTYREEVVAQTAQLKETQKQLQSACDRYADLFEFAPVCYVTLGHSGSIAHINLTGADLLGLERGRLVGTPLILHIESADRHTLLDHFRECRETRATCTAEVRLYARQRGAIPVQLSTHFDGNEYRMAISDLSERKQSEKRLEEQLELLGLARCAAQGGAWR